MNQIINEKKTQLMDICRKRRVRRLYIFGSAISERFDAARSDLDFLVEFHSMTPVEHADSYFGLEEDLQNLFGLPVDIIEPQTVSNPYFLEAVEETKVVLYNGANPGC